MPDYRQLRTARLRLSAVSLDDLDDFHALHTDPELFRHAPEAMHPDLEHSRTRIEEFIDDWAHWNLGYWTVRADDTGAYLGCAGVRRSEANWNVYYRLTTTAHGHGYAAEVIRAAAPAAEAIEPGAILQATMRPWNPASQAVAAGLGLEYCRTDVDVGGTQQLIYQAPAADLG